MATCKDCIHYGVCKQFNRNIPEEFEGIEFKCDWFTNAEDVFEVVRCKDCAHCIIPYPYGARCLRDNLWHNSNDFCSYGVRKE